MLSETKTTTIDPPPKLAHHRFHWAYRETDDQWLVFEVRDGTLWHSLGYSWNAATLHEKGWRYAGPAEPPAAPKAPRLTKAEKIAGMTDAEWERHVRRVGTQGNQPRPV